VQPSSEPKSPVKPHSPAVPMRTGGTGDGADRDALAAVLAAIGQKLDVLLERAGSPPQRFLSLASAARYADLGERTLRRMIAAGELGVYRPARGKLLIDRDQLDRLILGSTRQPRTGRGSARRTRGDDGRFE